jgi:hypothetical protein
LAVKEAWESFMEVLTDRGISIGAATLSDGELEEEIRYPEML